MEPVPCARHGSLCLLKTGVRDGPNRGKSFFVCRTPACGFVLPSDVPASHCLIHENSVVELQALLQPQSKKEYRLFYRCSQGRGEKQHWCGSVPWQSPDVRDLTKTEQAQGAAERLHNLPPTHPRNPFRVLDKNQEPSRWGQLSTGGREQKPAEGQKEKRNPKATEEEEQQQRWQRAEQLSRRPGETGVGETEGAVAPCSVGAGEIPAQKDPSKIGAERPPGARPEEPSAFPKPAQTKAGDWSDRARAEYDPPREAGPGGGRTGDDPREEKPLHSEPSRGHRADLAEEQGQGQAVARSLGDTGGDSGQGGPGAQGAPTKSEPPGDRWREDKSSDSEEEEGVAFLCKKPGHGPPPGPLLDSWQDRREAPGSAGQRTIPSFSEFRKDPQQAEPLDPRAQHGQLTAQLKQKKSTLASVNLQALPDKGQRLLKQIQMLEEALSSLILPKEAPEEQAPDAVQSRSQDPLSKRDPEPASGQGPEPPRPPSALGLSAPHQVGPGHSRHHRGGDVQEPVWAVWKRTSETIDHLHKSLETRPTAETEAEDPSGLKVSLLLHQRQALAWLLWRESQNPQGGILADDMGLGKTLTMISLVLAQKNKEQERDVGVKPALWISRDDSSIYTSRGTLIICPASLIHHWKQEVETRVDRGRLRVYLYHGPNRDQRAKVLSGYDLVITTYSLLAKEVPTAKEQGDVAAADPDLDPENSLSPLLRVAWARVILDEAHNIKNPRVQTSLAVCKLRAAARWAVTGTPVQNNLLDMYALLRFLRCSPFDNLKLWKSQVDDGSHKGAERLNILTKSLLLRRTKDQLDSAGKPLVSLPQRHSQLHRLQLSDSEQAVYNVLFAKSRSTLQSYLKRHDADSRPAAKSLTNPFDRVAQEFVSGGAGPSGAEAQSSSTVHILSLLLRLRQCCCHLSLLKTALDQSELKNEGISLSLEEQLGALTLTELHSPDPDSTVCLNGTRFQADLFEMTCESSKISCLLAELEAIRKQSQRSVIVSQWTSMLKIVAVHLQRLGLSFAVVDGSVHPKQRMDLVAAFNTDPKGPQVMLISLLAGGVGLNLTGGNHLFLLDMHWNPALEDQACDRIYRVGQQRDVVIHRFVCMGTVEEKILQLQARKKDLAKQVLTGTGPAFTKLTLADLRVLFGI
ncbi:transcription termination factor 2 [Ornithorhynchus anatinus]|uniref:transcription termination factor 2 n=1 Tax=Ornithorhynchus anatinus TaxID=9258 RepID=UPI0010A81C27|nr:transcription termination factor 2 [Ornithorhynchus anatinus]